MAREEELEARVEGAAVRAHVDRADAGAEEAGGRGEGGGKRVELLALRACARACASVCARACVCVCVFVPVDLPKSMRM